jgi:response regulator RpfG family c-di-GMP phosphodiesterase
MTERVLLVDDEQRILDGYRRNLHRRFQISTAPGAHEGITALTEDGPFAVVVSDLQMPGMDGIEFLGKVRELSPDTTRIMLTGQADLEASIAAVNQGRVFRFLTKPCSPEHLAAALDAGIEQYRLRTAERELLEQTLRGTVDLLVEVLGAANSAGQDQSERLKAHVATMSAGTVLDGDWELDLAASLSQLGTITLSDETRRRVVDGTELSPEEQDIVDHHPEAAYNMLSKIPRLENVARMIRLQAHPAEDFPPDVSADPVTQGALMIGLAVGYDRLLITGKTHREAVDALRRARPDEFSTALLDALSDAGGPAVSWRRADLALTEVHSGMVIDDDLHAVTGMLLVRKGQRLTPALLERLRSYADRIGLDREQVPVLAPRVDN